MINYKPLRELRILLPSVCSFCYDGCYSVLDNRSSGPATFFHRQSWTCIKVWCMALFLVLFIGCLYKAVLFSLFPSCVLTSEALFPCCLSLHPSSSHTQGSFCIVALLPEVHGQRCEIVGRLPSKGDTALLLSHSVMPVLIER